MVVGMDRAGCLAALSAAGVAYECVQHGEAATVEVHTEELRRAVEEKDAVEEPVPAVFRREGGGASQVKNLVLKDKKKGGIFLVSCDKDTSVDMKALSARLDVPKSAPLRMASGDTVASLGVSPGSVTPLCAAFLGAGTKLAVLLDARLRDHDAVLVHPMDNAATVAIAPLELERFLRGSGREEDVSIAWVDLAAGDKIDVVPQGAVAAEAGKSAAAPAKKQPEKKVDKRAKLAEEKQHAAESKPDGPPTNGVPSWAFTHVQWDDSIFARPDAVA